MADLVFMGTASFAVPSLRALVEAGHRVLAVVSQPDRPHGRGLKVEPTPVRAAAEALQLAVLQPPRASQPEFVDRLRRLAPEAIVVVAYGQFLNADVLGVPPLGCINLHASLLPELRGAAPIQWAVIRGLPVTGVTTMFIDAGMDSGDVIFGETERVLPGDTAGTLGRRLSELGARLLVRTVAEVAAGAAPRAPQAPERATYAPALRREDGALDWSRPALELRNRIHGCNPAPGAFARRRGAVVKAWRAEAASESPAAAPGTVIDARRLVLSTGEGALRLVEVQPASRSRMTGEEFCRGHQVTAGERWESGPGS